MNAPMLGKRRVDRAEALVEPGDVELRGHGGGVGGRGDYVTAASASGSAMGYENETAASKQARSGRDKNCKIRQPEERPADRLIFKPRPRGTKPEVAEGLEQGIPCLEQEGRQPCSDV